MDLFAMFISSIVMTIVGFATEGLFGINVKKAIFQMTMIFLFVPYIVFIMTATPGDPKALSYFTTNYLTTLVSALPGMLVGEIVGTLFAGIRRGLRKN